MKKLTKEEIRTLLRAGTMPELPAFRVPRGLVFKVASEMDDVHENLFDKIPEEFLTKTQGS